MIYLLTDIDDTLMQTALKMDADTPRYAAAVDADGNDLSFMSEDQKQLIDLYRANAEVIPVTGRSSWAMDRVKISFDSFKIVSHGALVLDQEGRPVQAWMDTIRSEYEAANSFLNECLAACEEFIRSHGLNVNVRLLNDLGVPVYLSLKGERGCTQSLSDLDAVESKLLQLIDGKAEGWRIHKNARNMALLPPYTCKKRASAWLMDHVGASKDSDLIVTAGDSVSDLPFMKTGHIMMIPSKSQIAEKHQI